MVKAPGVGKVQRLEGCKWHHRGFGIKQRVVMVSGQLIRWIVMMYGDLRPQCSSAAERETAGKTTYRAERNWEGGREDRRARGGKGGGRKCDEIWDMVSWCVSALLSGCINVILAFALLCEKLIWIISVLWLLKRSICKPITLSGTVCSQSLKSFNLLRHSMTVLVAVATCVYYCVNSIEYVCVFERERERGGGLS